MKRPLHRGLFFGEIQIVINGIMSNQWERRTTEQLNEQKQLIAQLHERINILQETLRNHGINPAR